MAEAPTPLDPNTVVEIKIRMRLGDPQNVQIEGPIHQKGLCYHMMALAHEAVAKWHFEHPRGLNDQVVPAPAQALEQLPDPPSKPSRILRP